MNASRLLGCLIFGLTLPFAIAASEDGIHRWRIMTVGDSITEGGGTFSCYRPILAEKLRASGVAFEFVGSRGEPPLRHEGYGGKNVEFLAKTVPAAFEKAPADIVLLHAGHNHFIEEKPVPGMIAATQRIIAAFRAANPKVIVLLAQVIPAGKLPKYAYIPELNAELALLAARLHTAAQPVILVDQAAGFEWRTDTIADLVHPNAAGAEKIAQRWWEALQPFLGGERLQSLNGPWEFSTDPAAARWTPIQVPGNWDTLPAYSTHVGQGWYRRDFTTPAAWAGRRVRLKFDAVYHDAVVSLNGVELGRHSGGYTPFEFDVTASIKPGEKNTVVVCADNTYRRGAWWHWGGISRSVTLVANHDARLVWQHIRSEPDLGSGGAEVVVRYKVANAGARPVTAALAGMLDGVAEPALAIRVVVAPRSDALVELRTSLAPGRVRLWHFDHPNLYRLTTQLRVDGEVVDTRSDRFGIRKVEVTRDSLRLNGERVRLCGFNRVADSREFGNTEPDALVRQDVDLMKRANGNLSRLMHYPQAPNLLDYLDEKGMMIWGEIPVWGDTDPQLQPENALTQRWMAEMIERDYNHPCIIGWSVGNEMAKHYDYVKSMVGFTQALDPHRLVTHVSFTGARADYNPSNDPITISPIILYNTYSYNQSAATIVHAKWPDKPIFFSEFGIKQFGAGADARIEGLEDMYRVATVGNPYVIGVSLWTFNDYRSDYKGTPPSGNREWGLVDVQRRPKAAYQQVRALFSPVHALTVTDGVIRVEPRRPEEVPSFTLRGYKLQWDGGELAVPDLKPGDPAWISTEKVKPGTLVRLMTPTGYHVADSR